MAKIPVTISSIYVSRGHDFKGRHGQTREQHPISKCDQVQCVAGKGIVGDRYFDYQENFKGQITFFDWQVYQSICSHFDKPDLDSSVFRRNIILKGIDLNTLIGKQFLLQEILFEGSEECRPCYWMDEAVTPGIEDFMKQGRGGLRARILSDGVLTTGDTMVSW